MNKLFCLFFIWAWLQNCFFVQEKPMCKLKADKMKCMINFHFFFSQLLGFRYTSVIFGVAFNIVVHLSKSWAILIGWTSTCPSGILWLFLIKPFLMHFASDFPHSVKKSRLLTLVGWDADSLIADAKPDIPNWCHIAWFQCSIRCSIVYPEASILCQDDCFQNDFGKQWCFHIASRCKYPQDLVPWA